MNQKDVEMDAYDAPGRGPVCVVDQDIGEEHDMCLAPHAGSRQAYPDQGGSFVFKKSSQSFFQNSHGPKMPTQAHEKSIFTINLEFEHQLKQLQRAFHWIEIQPLAVVILGDRAFSLGVVYAIGEDFVTTIVELAKLMKLVVFADLYRELCLYDQDWYLSPVTGFLVSKWCRQEVTEARKDLDELIAFISDAMSHPGKLINKLSDEYVIKYNRFLELWQKPILSDLFEAGRLFGEVLLAVIGLVCMVKGAASLTAKLPRLLKSMTDLSDDALRRLRFRQGVRRSGGGAGGGAKASPLHGDEFKGEGLPGKREKPLEPKQSESVLLGDKVADDVDRVLGDGVVPGNNLPLGARGPATAWDGFDEALAGGPVRDFTTDRIKVTIRGIEVVEKHTGRFGFDNANQIMIDRLKRIEAGEIDVTPQDLNFYSHELREYVRYRKLGYETGVPANTDAATDLWRQTHSATLDDYNLPLQADEFLYHPDALKVLYGD